MAEPTDADFEIVSGPRRVGDPHPEYKWAKFVGYDEAGKPIYTYEKMWIERHPWLTAILGFLAANLVIGVAHSLTGQPAQPVSAAPVVQPAASAPNPSRS